MFRRTIIKLTAVYLGIMMLISLFFSANIYQLSLEELDRGLRTQELHLPPGEGLPAQVRELIREEGRQRYNEAATRVLNRLLLTNLVILFAGGFASYFLARRTLRPIEEVHEAQRQFTADASHELRTPIAAMQSEIEVALMNPKLTLKEAKIQLTSNLEELAKLTSVTDGLLRLARFEQQDMPEREVSVRVIIGRAIERVVPLAEKKAIRIVQPTGVDGVVRGDETSLVEAVVTILDNAIKYSPTKTTIDIDCHLERQHVVIQITDHGIGIAPEHLPHIFDRFYRVDAARSKQASDGFGLGLAIAKNIIMHHGGSITVTSRRGEGSSFTLVLPGQ